MKTKMKYLLLFLVATVFVACEPSTQELIAGKWKYARLEQDGKPFLSSDPVEAKRIIDRHVSENLEYIKIVAKFRENAMNEMEQRLKVYFEFKSDSILTITDESMGQPMVEEWKYQIDEEKHVLTLKADTRKLEYAFKVKDDVLEFVDGTLKIELKKAKP